MASWGLSDEESSFSQLKLGRSSSAGFLSPVSRGGSSRSKSPAGLQQRNPKQLYQKSFEVAYRDIAEQRNFRRLELLFKEADDDDSGEMSLQEFRIALRKPWIQQSFSMLGVQPHQAEIVFKTMNKSKAGKREGIGIEDFMTGLETLVGGDLDGPPRDLDVDMLKPSYKAREKLVLAGGRPKHGANLKASAPTGRLSSSDVALGSPATVTPSGSQVLSEPSSSSLQKLSRPSSRASLRPANFVSVDWPEASRLQFESSSSRPSTPAEIATSGFFADEQHFKSTASAKALHSAAAARRRCTRVNSLFS